MINYETYLNIQYWGTQIVYLSKGLLTIASPLGKQVNDHSIIEIISNEAALPICELAFVELITHIADAEGFLIRILAINLTSKIKCQK